MSCKESLISFIMPVEAKINIVPVNPLTEEETKHSRSFLLLGPAQIQKTGLLFQAALTNASLGKKVVYITPKQFTRLPPSVHGLPHPVVENMELMEFMYLDTRKSLLKYLVKLSGTSADNPDVLIVENLQHYARQSPSFLASLLGLSALLTSIVNVIGFQKQVGCDLGNAPEELQVSWKNILCLSYEEMWCLEGRSNLLVHEDTEIRFTVAKPFIFLSEVTRVS